MGHIGYYTAIDWKTIKPWLTKILAGDIAGAEAMTCTELGGPTAPKKSQRRLNTAAKAAAAGPYVDRTLLSGPTTQATSGEYPWVTSFGYNIKADGGVWSAGCDGALVAKNLVLTASHCFESTDFSKDDAYIWPNAYDFTKISESQDDLRRATKILRHPCYTLENGGVPDCYQNGGCSSDNKPAEDIAVAVLAADVTSTTAYLPIFGYGDLAQEVASWPLDGSVAGFGRYCNPSFDGKTGCNYGDAKAADPARSDPTKAPAPAPEFSSALSSGTPCLFAAILAIAAATIGV